MSNTYGTGGKTLLKCFIKKQNVKVQDTVQWCAVVNMIIYVQVP